MQYDIPGGSKYVSNTCTYIYIYTYIYMHIYIYTHTEPTLDNLEVQGERLRDTVAKSGAWLGDR